MPIMDVTPATANRMPTLFARSGRVERCAPTVSTLLRSGVATGPLVRRPPQECFSNITLALDAPLTRYATSGLTACSRGPRCHKREWIFTRPVAGSSPVQHASHASARIANALRASRILLSPRDSDEHACRLAS
jgi:hypothetical protein